MPPEEIHFKYLFLNADGFSPKVRMAQYISMMPAEEENEAFLYGRQRTVEELIFSSKNA